MPYSEALLVLGALGVAGLAASTLATRFGVPSLVLFIAVGMAVGSEGVGLLDVDDFELVQTITGVALALILFDSGLSSGFREVRPVLATAVALASVGTIIVAGLSGAAAAALFGLPTREALALGAIVAATDSAAVQALLRRSTVDRQVARLLRAEAGLSAPVTVLLVVSIIDSIDDPGYGLADAATFAARELAVGLAIGVAVGWVSRAGGRRVRLETAGVYPVASLSMAAIAFGAADVVGGSGFLAVYVCGTFLGSGAFPAKQTVTSFHQGLAWLAQMSMFVTLGLLVFPSELGDVALQTIVLALVVVAVARPAAVLATTLATSFNTAEKAVLAWGGLRGGVPVLLALFAVTELSPHGILFFNVAFFTVLVSTLVQAVTFEPLARRLGVTSGLPTLERPVLEVGTLDRIGSAAANPGDAAP